MKRLSVSFSSGFLALLFLVCLGGVAHAARIGWSYVEGAALYRVEIQNQWGVPVATFDTPYIVADVQLIPGTYRLRISVLNKFRKVDAVGEWTPLVVKAGKKLEMQDYSPDSFRIGKGDRTLSVRGSNFPKDVTLRLEANGQVLRLALREITTSRITAVLPSWGLKPGTYTVVVETPDGRNATKPGFRVEQAPAPEIDSFSPESFEARGEVTLTIEGSYLGSRVTVALNSRAPGKPIPATVSGDTIRVLIPAETLAPGDYDLEITREDGRRVRQSGLRVRTAKKPVTDSGRSDGTQGTGRDSGRSDGTQGTGRDSGRSDGTQGTGRDGKQKSDSGDESCGLKTLWYLGLSVGQAIVENKAVSIKYYDTFFPTALVGYRMGAGFALEGWMTGTKLGLDYSSTAGLKDVTTTLLAFGLDLWWSPEFDFFLNPWVSAGFGLANTSMSIVSGSGLIKNLASRDGMLRTAVGVRAVLSDTFFLDLGFRNDQVLYKEGGLWFRGPFVRLGIGFGGADESPLVRPATNAGATQTASSNTPPTSGSEPASGETGFIFGFALAEADIGELTSGLDFSKAMQFEGVLGLQVGSGLELELSLRFLSARIDQNDPAMTMYRADLTMLGLSLDAWWGPDLGFFARPLLGVGAGTVNTGLLMTGLGSTLVDTSTMDLAFRAGALLRFEFVDWLRLDAGVRIEFINTMGGATVIGGPVLRVSLVL